MTNKNKHDYLKSCYNDAKKDRLVEEHKNRYYGGNTLFSLKEIEILAEMAEHDVWPDNNFGDDECLVWGLFHRLCANEAAEVFEKES